MNTRVKPYTIDQYRADMERRYDVMPAWYWDPTSILAHYHAASAECPHCCQRFRPGAVDRHVEQAHNSPDEVLLRATAQLRDCIERLDRDTPDELVSALTCVATALHAIIQRD